MGKGEIVARKTRTWEQEFENREDFLKYARDGFAVWEHLSSEYLYKLLLGRREGRKLSEVLDTAFLELCYATLDSWNMNSRGSKLVPFGDFEGRVMAQKERLFKLEERRLEKLDTEELDGILQDIEPIYAELSITHSNRTDEPAKSKMVANSKLLHFLLPELCMPMDREYTMNFFFGNGGVSWSKYKKTFKEFHKIIKRFGIGERDLKDMRSISACTLPKLVDNAIVGKQKFGGREE